jgi:hypothetical protein
MKPIIVTKFAVPANEFPVPGKMLRSTGSSAFADDDTAELVARVASSGFADFPSRVRVFHGVGFGQIAQALVIT